MSTDTSMRTIPKSWLVKPLSELCEQGKNSIVDGPFGSNLKRSDFLESGIPVLKLQNIKPNSIIQKNMDFVSLEKYEEIKRHSFRLGDIVMTKLGDPLGVSAIVTNIESGVIVADLVRVRPKNVNTKFLCYQLNSPMIAKHLNDNQKGTTRPRINLSIVRELKLNIPPLDEQVKIVEILEEQLSRLDAALASVSAVREKAARFRGSLLHVAFTGALTGHDTSDGLFPDGWVGGSLGEFCEMYQPKTISTKELIELGEFPVYGANGQIGFYDKYNHEDSEVTVTCRGATCGTVNVIPAKSWITGNAMVVRPIDNCMSKQLLSLQLQSLDFTQVITGTAQPQITRTTLTEIKVVLPPIDEQDKIVQILEEQLSRLDASLAVADLIQKKASALRRSLLHAAFTGELTKEWREGTHV